MCTIVPWGRPGHVHCEQPYSWSEVLHEYKDIKKVGGLGKLLVRGGSEVESCGDVWRRYSVTLVETWICILGHFCGDPYFFWVYHEADKVFTPWGTNSSGIPNSNSSASHTRLNVFASMPTGNIV